MADTIRPVKDYIWSLARKENQRKKDSRNKTIIWKTENWKLKTKKTRLAGYICC